MKNCGWSYQEQLGPDAAGRSALEYLSSRYRHSTPDCWRERLERGEVSVGGATIGADRALRAGERLCWRRPPWEEPEVPLHFEVLHEDAELLVVSKPAGLPTMPGAGFLAHTLLSLVRARDERWTPMHRLGRGTSGLVAFARTPEACSRLQADWRERRVLKTYLALASGVLPQAPFAIEAPIGPVAHPLLGSIHAASPSGRASRSEVRRLGLRAGASLAEVRIETGRPHQIRIHLAFAGHPLVGDPLYGPGGVPVGSALPGEIGYHLHAWRLEFEHPRDGGRVAFEAPPPAALSVAQ